MLIEKMIADKVAPRQAAMSVAPSPARAGATMMPASGSVYWPAIGSPTPPKWNASSAHWDSG
ncbi:MAG: hypothetical protein ACHQFZ_03865 [Acidimicrobiales bacterium]